MVLIMTDTEARISLRNNKIIVELPITRPTSKFRVKKKTESGFGIPVPTRKEPFPDYEELMKYYIEWQISYVKGGSYDYELSHIVRLAYNNGILRDEDLHDILKFADNVTNYLENMEIARKYWREELYGFKIYRDIYPTARKEFDTGEFIEITLKHKQRAIGYQSMIYLCIPLTRVRAETSLANRTARPNETVTYEFSPKIIKELLKAFIIASKAHKQDIVSFIKSLLRNRWW